MLSRSSKKFCFVVVKAELREVRGFEILW